MASTVADLGTKRLPPGPHSWVPGRLLMRLRHNPLRFFDENRKAFGGLVSFKAFGKRFAIVADPKLACEVLLVQADAFHKGPALAKSKAFFGEGLLTSEGAEHRRQRKLIQPAFHAKHAAI